MFPVRAVLRDAPSSSTPRLKPLPPFFFTWSSNRTPFRTPETGTLIFALQDALNWRVRALAIEELQHLIRYMKDINVLRSHLDTFMPFMTMLLRDPNFKIEINALQIIGDVVSIVGRDIAPHGAGVMKQLIEKLGDNKTLVRQANGKVIEIRLALARGSGRGPRRL